MTTLFSSLLSLMPQLSTADTSTISELHKIKTFSLESIIDAWGPKAINFGIKVVLAIFAFYIGRVIAKYLLRLLNKVMKARGFEPSIASFLYSLTSITLTIVVIIVAISVLGVQSVGFAALLASAGVGIGMGLSGQLQNLAGGLIILLTKPFKVGDHIIAQSIEGTVDAIMIFHTVVRSFDNRKVFIPNGKLSGDVVTNVAFERSRRVSWTFGVEYGQDYDTVKSILEELLQADPRVLKEPSPYVVLNELADSSVDIMVRAFADTEDVYPLYWDFNQTVYKEFNRRGISFPFPQLTIHKASIAESEITH